MIDLIAIHRILVSPSGYADTPHGIENYFRFKMGWRHPAYNAVLWYDRHGGEVWRRWQWAPIGAATNHAGADWTTGCVSIAHVGDFRTEAPSDALWRLSIATAAELAWALDLVPERRTARQGRIIHEVSSHEELARAEDRIWRCPGGAWPMHRYRAEVERERARLALDLPCVPPAERLALIGWQ